ncbi:MAG TPA: metallophosphoesterase [Pedobacter sp.]|jgi:Icc-related predicted phosphoesterase
MTEDKLVAIISDIHGNSWALEKVLEDIESRGIKTILNLGDSLYGPLDPKGTFELISCKGLNLLSICGNQDRVILENLELKSNSPTLEFVKSQLDTDIKSWLKSLAFDLNFEDTIYCCHASPASDSISSWKISNRIL